MLDSCQHGRGGDRFVQKAVKSAGFRLLPDILAAIGGDHDNGWWFAEIMVGLDTAGGLNTIHAGHLPVHKDQIVRGSGLFGFCKFCQAFFSRSDDSDLELERFQHFLQDLPGNVTIIDD